MTLPFERKNSVNKTRELLYDLLDPKKTPRVPKELRLRAGSCLRHFPHEMEMDQAGKESPDVFGESAVFEKLKK